MSPFIANPMGLSPQTLELLDRTLSEVWRELRLKDKLPAEARAITPADPIAFAFDAPAELFWNEGPGTGRGPMRYRRFNSGAQAIRYAIEELPAALLLGSIIEVDEDRFDARQIRELYDCPAYPLPRAA
jgi:hypothetical protein